MQFKLSKNFIEKYKDKDPDWGPLGKLTYKRSYARELDDGKLEEWYQTCERVVNGIYELQRRHVVDHLGSPWNTSKAQKSAQEMYAYMFDMKFLPPGRGLAQMGSDFVMNDTGAASCFNCAFFSTENIDQDFSSPFCLLLEVGMYGVGPGFDTRGAGKVKLREPKVSGNFVVEDSREGWSALIKRILDSYVGIGSFPENIDYSQIRPFGTKIKRFGGTSSGPEALMDLVDNIKKTLDTPESNITSPQIVDLANYIGVAVVAGGSRRIAEIAFGAHDDKEYLSLKDDYEKVKTHRWASNNSIFAEIGMDYSEVSKHTAETGEPGYMWLDNARKYSRMGLHAPDFKDMLVAGANPCQPGWATVLTKKGIRQLKDVVPGIEIWSELGWTKITNKWCTGKKIVYKYQTTAGRFFSTEQHQIVSNGKKIKIKNAETIDTLSGNYNSKNIILNPQDIMDGLLIGDGSVHKASNNLIYLLVGVNDQDYFKSEIKHLIIKKREGLNKNGYEVKTTLTKKDLPKTYERIIPKRFLYGNSKKVRGFLKGLYSANGSICGNRITLKATSKDLIDAVQIMLSSLGIQSYYTSNKSKNINFNNGTYTCKESFDLNISHDRDKFQILIGFLQNYKNLKLQKILDTVGKSNLARTKYKNSYEIISTEYISDEDVFDITVDNDTHTYWSEGFNVSNCNEQSLEDSELCCLVESFPARCENLSEYKRVLKFAYLYAKTTTLLKTPWPKTNAIMLKNRRIGLSQSGVLDNIAKVGFREHMRWCDEGYNIIKYWDEIYSDWLCIPRSKKKTSEKPSGSVSLLTGSRPGVHDTPAKSKWYIRRVEVLKNSPLVKAYKDAGYNVPQSVYKKESLVIEVPVEEKNWTPFPLSIWPQLELAAQMQEHWADNQVSCTVYVPDHEKEQLALALSMYETRLKGISFLPYNNNYEQAPYEAISEEKYIELIKNLKPVDLSNAYHEVTDKFCDSDVCQI